MDVKANDMKKMREALCEIVLLCQKVGLSIHGDVACGIISSKARAALAAKPRQCDMGTPEEQSMRWWKFCDRHFLNSPSKDNCAKCPIRGTNRHCEFAWAQMPYEENESEAK